jgi:hypothetical protein
MTQDEITKRLDRLEAQLDDQQETIARQQERIDEREAIIEAQRERLTGETEPATASAPAEAKQEGSGTIATRRAVLTAGGVLGVLGLGVGTASADPQGQIGNSTNPLQELHTQDLYGSSGALTLQDDLVFGGGGAIQDPSGNAHITINDNGNTKFNRTVEDSAGNAIDDFTGSNLSVSGGTLDAGIGGTVNYQKNILSTDTQSQATLRNNLDFTNLDTSNTYRFTYNLRLSLTNGGATDFELYWANGGTPIIGVADVQEVDDAPDVLTGSVIFEPTGTDVTTNVVELTEDILGPGASNSPGSFSMLEELSNHTEVTSFGNSLGIYRSRSR